MKDNRIIIRMNSRRKAIWMREKRVLSETRMRRFRKIR
jgi:hypothetical protein